MDDWLIDDDQLPLGRRSVLPGAGFFSPDSFEAEQAEREAAERLDSDVAVIADPDADGLACTALVRAARGAGELVPAGPHNLDDALSWAAEYATPETDLIICDLCPDSPEDIESVGAVADRVRSVAWYDHHQWDEALVTAVRDAGVDLVVGESGAVCSADVTLEE
ncbi:MAG: oligoribonuclease NrnB/cAMP/cGMP phosphodiesterase (DHH superfamily), partial [Natronomonas sp.]